jgi:hypothetical protein
MKRAAVFAVVAVGLAGTGCVPDWAQTNSAPYILEISNIQPTHLFSDVQIGEGSIENDDVQVSVNAFRKNNNANLNTSPVEHMYLERYEVRYFRTDGRNQEGVDVPFRITGPLGNLRFHTITQSELELTVPITIVRHQAKLEPPLRNLRFLAPTDTGTEQAGGASVMTTIAEITIHARTVQGEALVARGNVQVSFANFADQ